VLVSDSASFSSGISGRYATALFDLAKSEGALDHVERDLDALDAALSDSGDLRDLIRSPIYTRSDQAAAMKSICDKMGLSPLVANTIGVMAQKRRLFVVPDVISGVKGLIAQDKGEVTVEVVSATPLSDDQANALAETLRKSVGKDIKISTTVDESLLGGLVVKVGSRMIDTSIRAKLSKLQNIMKEVG